MQFLRLYQSTGNGIGTVEKKPLLYQKDNSLTTSLLSLLVVFSNFTRTWISARSVIAAL